MHVGHELRWKVQHHFMEEHTDRGRLSTNSVPEFRCFRCRTLAQEVFSELLRDLDVLHGKYEAA